MIYITGDIHGSPEPIYELFEKCHPTAEDIIVLLGDVGVNYTGRLRDRMVKEDISALKSTFFCIHWNHENRPQNIASYKEKEFIVNSHSELFNHERVKNVSVRFEC